MKLKKADLSDYVFVMTTYEKFNKIIKKKCNLKLLKYLKLSLLGSQAFWYKSEFSTTFCCWDKDIGIQTHRQKNHVFENDFYQ